MSFGFSVGDLIGAANLTYRLIKALQGTQDAGAEFRLAIEELGAFQQALIRVSCLESDKNLPRATYESASCIIMGSMTIIESYVERTKKYDQSFGLGKGFRHNWRKMGWALFKAEEMKKLRETLHARLAALSLLLAAANLDAGGVAGQYMQKPEVESEAAEAAAAIATAVATAETPLEPQVEVSSTSSIASRPASSTIGSIDSGIDLGSPSASTQATDPSASNTTAPSTATAADVLSRKAIRLIPDDELVSVLANQSVREAKIREVATLLQFLVSINKHGLEGKEYETLSGLLDKLCGNKPMSSAPIRFKDAVGRKFSFPFHLARTWQGIEELIKQAFLQVDVIGPHVQEGHYDLIGPDGEIILPSVWEKVIEPDMAITMTMWPMEKSPIPLQGRRGHLPPSFTPPPPHPPGSRPQMGSRRTPELPLRSMRSSPGRDASPGYIPPSTASPQPTSPFAPVKPPRNIKHQSRKDASPDHVPPPQSPLQPSRLSEEMSQGNESWQTESSDE